MPDLMLKEYSVQVKKRNLAFMLKDTIPFAFFFFALVQTNAGDVRCVLFIQPYE